MIQQHQINNFFSFLIKVLDKKLFKDKKEAEKYYEQQEFGKHITVELSVYFDGNERSLKNKGEK